MDPIGNDADVISCLPARWGTFLMKKDPPIEVAKNGVGLGLEGTGVAPGEGCVVPSVEDLADISCV